MVHRGARRPHLVLVKDENISVMAQQVEADDLICGVRIVEGENQPLQVVLLPP